MTYKPVETPVGAIIGWHKSFTGTPSIPFGWVECNGQTLSDPDSPYDGQVIPDLNGGNRFLRGASTSGTMQDDAIQGHKHSITSSGSHTHREIGYASSGGIDGPAPLVQTVTSATYTTAATDYMGAASHLHNASDFSASLSDDGTNGTPRTASETRPKNMSIVWIIRIK